MKLVDVIHASTASADGVYRTQGIAFDDGIVYNDITDYIDLEVKPVIEKGKKLKHKITYEDLSSLLTVTELPIRQILQLIELGKKEFPYKIEDLYSAFSYYARIRVMYSLVGGSTIPLNLVQDLTNDKNLIEIAKAYDLSQNQENEASRLKAEIENNPQDFAIEFIRQLPSDNAYKFVLGFGSFVKKYSDRLNKEVILKEMENLDNKKYGDKSELLTCMKSHFL